MDGQKEIFEAITYVLPEFVGLLYEKLEKTRKNSPRKNRITQTTFPLNRTMEAHLTALSKGINITHLL